LCEKCKQGVGEELFLPKKHKLFLGELFKNRKNGLKKLTKGNELYTFYF
jgi:hypothetical protein